MDDPMLSHLYTTLQYICEHTNRILLDQILAFLQQSLIKHIYYPA
jgi:hypothetical protein